MVIKKDSKGQPYIEWTPAPGGHKRAWIKRKNDREKDRASTPSGRYLSVARIEALGAGPAGNPTDFPIFSNLPDEQILLAFVSAVSAITGCQLKVDPAGIARDDVAVEEEASADLFLKVDPAG